MESGNEGLLTLAEAARFLGVSKISLRRWTRNNTLLCVRVGQRKDRRFRLEDLEEYVNTHISRPDSAADATVPVPLRSQLVLNSVTMGEAASHA